MPRLLPFLDKEPNHQTIMEPTNADFQMMLAQIRRDHGLLSDREMAKLEVQVTGQARQSRRIFNPFTGELRKVSY